MSEAGSLTHYGLVMPDRVLDLGQYFHQVMFWADKASIRNLFCTAIGLITHCLEQMIFLDIFQTTQITFLNTLRNLLPFHRRQFQMHFLE